MVSPGTASGRNLAYQLFKSPAWKIRLPSVSTIHETPLSVLPNAHTETISSDHVPPSAIIFSYLASFHIHAPFVPFLAFVMAAFSALRLAKFNLDERQALGFIGLPTPANALFWGSLIVGLDQYEVDFEGQEWIILVGTFISCYLLIAEIPMFALKFKHWGWKDNEVKYVFLLSCIPLLLFLGFIGLAAIIAWYVILSIATTKK